MRLIYAFYFIFFQVCLKKENYFKFLWPFQNVRTFNFRLISRQINPYARIGGNSAAFPVALAPKRRLVVATFCCDNFSVKMLRHTAVAVALAAAAAEVRTTDGRSRPGDRRRPAPVFSLLILF